MRRMQIQSGWCRLFIGGGVVGGSGFGFSLDVDSLIYLACTKLDTMQK